MLHAAEPQARGMLHAAHCTAAFWCACHAQPSHAAHGEPHVGCGWMHAASGQRVSCVCAFLLVCCECVIASSICCTAAFNRFSALAFGTSFATGRWCSKTTSCRIPECPPTQHPNYNMQHYRIPQAAAKLISTSRIGHVPGWDTMPSRILSLASSPLGAHERARARFGTIARPGAHAARAQRVLGASGGRFKISP